MSKKPILIGLTGKARSGKDTVADFLVEHHGFKKYAIADGLKEAALAVNPIVQWDPYSEKPVRLTHVVNGIGWEDAKDTFPEVRRFLQVLGTDAGWKIHGEGCWMRILEDRAHPILLGDRVVISDVRFPHEALWLREMTGTSIVGSVERDHNSGIVGTALGAHESENGKIPLDFTILNLGSLDDLRGQVHRLVRLIEAGEYHDFR